MLSTVFAPSSKAEYRSLSGHRMSAPAVFEAEMHHGTVRHAAAREHVFFAGDPLTHVYIIDSGAVCLYKTAADGRRRVVQFAFPGDLIGLEARKEHSMSAQALRPLRLSCLPAATLIRMAAKDTSLASRLFEALSNELASLHDHLLIIGQRNALECVAAFLLSLSRRKKRNGGNPAALVLPMTRADIGDFLGLTPETVCRMLTELRTAGLIETGHSSSITLTNLEKLEKLVTIG